MTFNFCYQLEFQHVVQVSCTPLDEASRIYELFKSGEHANFILAMSLIDAVLEGLEVLPVTSTTTDDGQSRRQAFKMLTKINIICCLMWTLLTSSPQKKPKNFAIKPKIIDTTTSSIPALSVFQT